MKKHYVVELDHAQRQHLQQLVHTGHAPARTIQRAHILLKADVGQHASGKALTDRQIADALDCAATTVQRTRRSFWREGLEAALHRAPTTRVYEKALDGRAEAHLIALACSEPPPGHARWTMRLLAEKMVAFDYVETVSRETVRRTLKKTRSSPT